MRDDGSADYAAHRVALAQSRVERWSREVTTLEDRRDRMRTQGWRTRLTNQIARAMRSLARASRDAVRWNGALDERQYDQDEGVGEAETFAVEWEIGVDYEAANGSAHDVDINIRLRRTDGRSFGYSEAKRAMSVLRENVSLGRLDPAPLGYEIAGISWRSPGRGSRGWRRGDWSERGGLADVLYIASEAPDLWRMGGVE